MTRAVVSYRVFCRLARRLPITAAVANLHLLEIDSMSRMKDLGIGLPLVVKYYRRRAARRLASLGASVVAFFRPGGGRLAPLARREDGTGRSPRRCTRVLDGPTTTV